MDAMKANDFMLNLQKQLMNKEHPISEKSATSYLRCLWILNDSRPFTNLSFLRNTEEVDKIISEKSENTQKTYYACLSSVLSLMKGKPTYKKAIEHYASIMDDKSKAHRAKEDSHEKSDKQKESWIEWDDVLARKAELKAEVDKFISKKELSERQYDKLLQFILLSLYSDIQPRRNEYQLMDVVGSHSEDDQKKEEAKSEKERRNFLDWNAKKFYFHNYKTWKKYKMDVLDFKDNQPLIDALTLYFKYHPQHKGKITKATRFNLLTYSDGKPFSSVNSITRILNKVFGKNIGSSMLRHIYLSSKYGDVLEEQKEDAKAMGHSMAEQKDYIKK
jgi:hypothetical protein